MIGVGTTAEGRGFGAATRTGCGVMTMEVGGADAKGEAVEGVEENCTGAESEEAESAGGAVVVCVVS